RVLRARVGEGADQVGGVGRAPVLERPAGRGRPPLAPDVVSVCGRPRVVAAGVRPGEGRAHRAATFLSSFRADMSEFPRNIAPSAITIFGARMFPVRRPVAWI